MAAARFSSYERRKREVAGGVVLQVLRNLPDSASAQILRELIDMALVDPEERGLFDFLGGGPPDQDTAPVVSPRPPTLSGGAAAYAE